MSCLGFDSSRIKETKRDFAEKYSQKRRLKTEDGAEVYILGLKTFADRISQAQEEAANSKRPGPSQIEVSSWLMLITSSDCSSKPNIEQTSKFPTKYFGSVVNFVILILKFSSSMGELG